VTLVPMCYPQYSSNRRIIQGKCGNFGFPPGTVIAILFVSACSLVLSLVVDNSDYDETVRLSVPKDLALGRRDSSSPLRSGSERHCFKFSVVHY